MTAVNNGDDGWLESLEFADGTVREYRGGFAVYGSDYNNDLATQLGCDCNDDGTVAVDDHGRTSVEGVYAIGDLTPGHNQIPVTMGEGAKTGIIIHTECREFPKPLDALDDGSKVENQYVPAISQALRDAKARRARGDD